MARYTLTVRHGPDVERSRFDDLPAALAELAERVHSVRGEGPLAEVSMLRRFEPGARVAARIEISTGSFPRKRDAGLDVMGDGALVAFSGGVRRRELARGHDVDIAIKAVEASLC